jgi:outer membrane receptor protein involved in Fe transport
VNIRGITSSEQGRVLALVDGLPINKTDGGSVNWNRISANEVDRIEVFKGPGSSVYGNNAMGGVINIITKNPKNQGYQGYAAANGGTYNTIEERAGFSGRMSSEGGLYFRIAGYNRTSDGYNNVREAFRDAFTINGAMKEHGLDAKLGYDLSENTTLQAKYNFFDDRRGNGKKAKEENYQQYKTHYGSFRVNTTLSDIAVSSDVFYQIENYLRTTEKYRTTSTGAFSSYDLIFVDADRADYGANVNLATQFGEHTLNAGFEAKVGSIDGADVYQTSTDVVANKGKMTFLSAFIQDEFRVTENLKFFAGFRYDRVTFHDGAFTVTGATASSSFMLPVAGPLREHTWDAATPKFSLRYSFNENLSSYIAYSRGFRAASLDDLTRSGLISGGFKKANPELQPESVDNYELGFNFDIDKSLYIMPSIYTMTGHDFMYYINTGDSLVQGRSKRPIIIKNNITQVKFIGADVDVKYFLASGFYCFANYTYTHSEILSFRGNTKLEGKELTNTPRQMFNVGMSSLNSIVNASFNIHFQDIQYVSDDNAEKDGSGNSLIVPNGYTVDLKIWKKFFNLVTATVSVQNLFDRNDLTTYDRYTPGRIIYGGISCEF